MTATWKLRAACLDHPDLDWFATNAKGIEAARKVCYGCPVRLECLEYGRSDPHGLWGGKTAQERAEGDAEGALFGVAAVEAEERHDRATYVSGSHHDCARCRAANAQWISEWRARVTPTRGFEQTAIDLWETA